MFVEACAKIGQAERLHDLAPTAVVIKRNY